MVLFGDGELVLGISCRLRSRCWLKSGTKSRLRGLSVRGDLSALFEDGFQIEVARIGDMCRPGRRAGED